MGLDTSFDCWHGAYSAFFRWRRELAKCTNIDLDRMEGYGGAISWDTINDSIKIILNHSDCDGEISVSDLLPLTDRLAELLPLLPAVDDPGHIGNWRDKTQQFIDGLREAAIENQPIEFG